MASRFADVGLTKTAFAKSPGADRGAGRGARPGAFFRSAFAGNGVSGASDIEGKVAMGSSERTWTESEFQWRMRCSSFRLLILNVGSSLGQDLGPLHDHRPVPLRQGVGILLPCKQSSEKSEIAN